ncbi:MAG: tyrosine-protein phosphatase [Bacteroidaceae bacterium]|nr:tyrosine-protein phosphatase [Bacteroidaceae bacterium]
MKTLILNLRLSFLLALLVFTATVQCQTEYATVLQNANWGWQSRAGVTYGKASFADLYGDPQMLSIAKYSQASMSTSLYVKEHSTLGTNGLAAEAGATAAINGSYFNMTTLTSTTALWVGGTEIATTAPEEFARCNGIVGFKDGVFSIEPYGSSTTDAELASWGKKYDSFVVSGPILRRGGVSMDANIGGEGFYGPNPRTMLGKCADGTVYMIVAEGRMDGAKGFSLENLVHLAEDLGMSDAINLDGGGSSTLWVTGAGIINRTSDGSVRKVPNIVFTIPSTHVHSYTNGFCTCEAAPYEPASQDSEGYYEIDNGGKLFWLAHMVNNGNNKLDAKLTADIDLENRLWTPMGNSDNKHTGEFDGQNHNIQNLNIVTDASTLYSAFIGLHSGTKDVHNFKLSGSVTASGTTENHYAAGVVAYSTGAHKIQDIWCSANITNPATELVSLRMAGIVTKAEGGTINRCVYDGTVNGAATNLQVAGILGWPNANNTTVSNCLFAGSLISTGRSSNSAYMGGIIGYSSSARSGLSFANNLSIGSIESPKSAIRSGALVGNNTAATTAFSNNYILEGLTACGSSTSSGKVPAVTEVTTAQLTDGTLPAMLDADNWTQGTEYPVPQGQDDGGQSTTDDMTVNGIKYAITSSNTVSVTYPNAEQPSSSNPCPYSGVVTIPQTVTIKGKTYNVTAIGDYAFHCANITALNLPEGITHLGYKSIYQTQLTEIVVPNSVTLMDYEALGYNKVLVKITFGENIAANTWGDKLCIYGGKKYEVYMNCDAVPKLRSYTFDFTGANVHVRPSMYAAFTEDAAWNSYDIIGDLWKEYTFADLQAVLREYSPKVPTDDAIGTDPGCYSTSTAKAFSDAVADAQTLDENATLEQLNKAINGIMIAYDALYCYPLHEGYYYIENVSFPGYVLTGDPSSAKREGLKAVALEGLETPPYFKLTRKNGNWLMQCADNGMFVGTVVGSNSSGRPISLTGDARYEQVITWVGGGRFKIQGTATYPYAYTGSRVGVYNYSTGSNLEVRQMWRLHPATAGMFSMDYNLENGRVQGFVHDFEYTESDASKISTYNVGPPERRDWPLPVEVYWTQDDSADAQLITWSESPDFADAVTQSVPTESASYEIYNLIPGRIYYCKVEQQKGEDTETVANFSFNTAGQMRHLKAEGTANVRDLGGWTTASGCPVRYGKIFRGAEWNGGHNLEPEAIQALRRAGIKAELDLRSDSEAKSITKSVLGNDILYKRTALGQTQSHMEGLTNSKSTYQAALQFVLSCVKNDKPVYFHCAIGRDRTGTLAFLLEGVLGMSKSDIYKDYELTNFSYFNTPCSKGQLDAMFAMIEALEGETLEQKFRTYLTTEFGITGQDIDMFRTKMLVAEDDPDMIKEVQPSSQSTGADMHDGQWYDLSGRKIANRKLSNSKWPRGIYIVNGKKVMVPQASN